MLARYSLPEIPPSTSFSYVHRASRNPNTQSLEVLLDHGADPHGGENCPHPPIVALLRHMGQPKPPDLAVSMCQATRLLVREESYTLPGLREILDAIYNYDGPDSDRKVLSGLIRKQFKSALP